MQALTFTAPGKISLTKKPIPKPGYGEALIRITTTTICGTDVHILRGEYPVKPGLTLGHEPVGTIAAMGPGVSGFTTGQRVIAGAITPCGQCHSCLGGHSSQCRGKPMGGWRFGNTIDGTQAEYALIPDAMANLAPIPDQLSDEEVLMCPDIMSTGFGGAENGNIQIGDTVVVFAQGPIGLCATAGARLRGASKIIVVDAVESRLIMARNIGADITLNIKNSNPVEEILRLTENRGADVAIEALGSQQTFESCLRVLKPGGTLSSLGVYSKPLTIPLDAFNAGLGEHKIVTTLCPGGSERMRRLMSIVASGRVNFKPLVTHRFKLGQIIDAYELFASQRDGVLKVAITP
ncbi:MAG TPA: alcohol dehydrogenase [Bdellovibrionales bacterium]|nr:MAG: alcohol dehydrogenase [Bdellovibrionales bacterium GWB1_52_6]OFZ04937.1 MAG: alcohol dehydrogenase [Bdellovibrionales bacterium GWA1_52_35]HAR42525.1 alcohol dehydrogenase [Bdellovibrionales bacterium]HCM38844.1 alcohol dehydrogenase [Bdellovibrionales bacterium]